MKFNKSKQFKIINKNSVMIQNWRNENITLYTKRGYDVMEVMNYIDDILYDFSKKYVKDYNDTVLDVKIEKISKSSFSGLNAKLSVKYPPRMR